MKLRARHWFVLAAAIRITAACTRVNWHYPDEWYQTIEFARLLLGKSATYSHEMGLHLRNLSWPALLTLPLSAADFLAPHWTHFRLIAAQLFAGALDLGALWAFTRLARAWPPLWRNLGFAFLILAWFQVQDSVSLGAEHVCVCLIWITLALLGDRRFFWAGVLSVGVFAAKYPAGLVTAGFTLAVFAQSRRTWLNSAQSLAKNERDARSSGSWLFLGGLLFGAIVFGSCDWIFYGRPWESLWMYLQYNVLTSAGITTFGRQNLYPYFDFLQSRWFRVLLPFGLALLAGGVASLARDLRKFEPWAWAFLAYLAGHLLVHHREARFMLPAEALLVFGALKYAAENYPNWRPKRWAIGLGGLVFVLNLALVLKAAIAETGTLNSNYFEIDQRLQENPHACAVISQRMLGSLLIPGGLIPPITFGYFAAERRHPTFAQAALEPLAWYHESPHCTETDTVLLLVDRPDAGWVENGCRLQRSGILEILPEDLWVTFLHRGWVSGPWYACPPSVLALFKNTTVEEPFVDHLVRFEKLPPLGISADDLVALGKTHEAPHSCKWACP